MATGENLKVKAWERICGNNWTKFLLESKKLFVSIPRIALTGGTVIEVNSFLQQVKLYVNEKP